MEIYVKLKFTSGANTCDKLAIKTLKRIPLNLFKFWYCWIWTGFDFDFHSRNHKNKVQGGHSYLNLLHFLNYLWFLFGSWTVFEIIALNVLDLCNMFLNFLKNFLWVYNNTSTKVGWTGSVNWWQMLTVNLMGRGFNKFMMPATLKVLKICECVQSKLTNLGKFIFYLFQKFDAASIFWVKQF